MALSLSHKKNNVYTQMCGYTTVLLPARWATHWRDTCQTQNTIFGELRDGYFDLAGAPPCHQLTVPCNKLQSINDGALSHTQN